MGHIFSDYVNDCQSFWSINYPNYASVTNPVGGPNNPGFEISVFNDPTTGTSSGGYNGENENIDLIVLGFNPAGTVNKKKIMYSPQTLISGTKGFVNALYTYNPYITNPPLCNYTRQVSLFASQCGYPNSYAKIDAFGILQADQSILERDIIINGHNGKYDPILNLSVSTMIKLKPKIIVFANAGLRRLFVDNHLFANFINIKGWNNKPCKIAMDIELPVPNSKPYKCLGIFTTMLSGGHLDKGTRDILIKVIRNL